MRRITWLMGAVLSLLFTVPAAAGALDAPDYRPTKREQVKKKKKAPPVEQGFGTTIVLERDKSNLVICSEGAASGEELESALEACNAAIEEEPENGDAFYFRGFTLFHMERYVEAERDFTSAIDLKANRLAESYYQRGVCKERQHRLRDASRDFKAAFDLKPDWSAARRKVEEYRWAYQSD